MLIPRNRSAYTAAFGPQYERLYAGDGWSSWAWEPGNAIFRDPKWGIAPLAGDPWRSGPLSESEGAAPGAEVDPEDMRRRYRHERFWRPWECVLRERNIDRILISVCEELPEDFPHKGAPCAVSCDLDWSDIASIVGTLEIQVAHARALFSMSPDWAMCCWEGFSVLGGTPDFMARYGELAGGWDRLRADFQAHLDTDYEFYEFDDYRIAVEKAFAGPDVAWTKLGRGC